MKNKGLKVIYELEQIQEVSTILTLDINKTSKKNSLTYTCKTFQSITPTIQYINNIECSSNVI